MNSEVNKEQMIPSTDLKELQEIIEKLKAEVKTQREEFVEKLAANEEKLAAKEEELAVNKEEMAKKDEKLEANKEIMNVQQELIEVQKEENEKLSVLLHVTQEIGKKSMKK